MQKEKKNPALYQVELFWEVGDKSLETHLSEARVQRGGQKLRVEQEHWAKPSSTSVPSLTMRKGGTWNLQCTEDNHTNNKTQP